VFSKRETVFQEGVSPNSNFVIKKVDGDRMAINKD
jgi:hypothetical protein